MVGPNDPNDQNAQAAPAQPVQGVGAGGQPAANNPAAEAGGQQPAANNPAAVPGQPVPPPAMAQPVQRPAPAPAPAPVQAYAINNNQADQLQQLGRNIDSRAEVALEQFNKEQQELTQKHSESQQQLKQATRGKVEKEYGGANDRWAQKETGGPFEAWKQANALFADKYFARKQIELDSGIDKNKAPDAPKPEKGGVNIELNEKADDHEITMKSADPQDMAIIGPLANAWAASINCPYRLHTDGAWHNNENAGSDTVKADSQEGQDFLGELNNAARGFKAYVENSPLNTNSIKLNIDDKTTSEEASQIAPRI